MNFDTEQKPLKTWSHLARNRRKPSEYDIVSKVLHYSTNNPDAPWEQAPDSPMNRWYKKYRNSTGLQHDNWDAFSDPDRLVYRTYNLLQDGQEHHVHSLFDQFHERQHDLMLDRAWVEALPTCYTPLRYLFHALQMSSAYVMQLAPASTISNCAIFQAADFMRRVAHTCYRTTELARHYPEAGFGETEREVWENGPIFQPFRELVEKQLVVYDWSEAFVSLSLVVLPAVSEGVLRPLQETSHIHNDTLMPLMIGSQLNDSERHDRWARALVDMLVEQSEDNLRLIRDFTQKWSPLGEAAIRAYSSSLPECPISGDDAVTAASQKRAFLWD